MARTPDPLLTAFRQSESLTDAAAREKLRELCGRPLMCDDADLLQCLAARLGVRLSWKHHLLDGESWKDGRKQQN